VDDLLESSKESNGLNGLAETHFICKDDMLPLLPSKVKPIEAF